jgi:hypothetical protein
MILAGTWFPKVGKSSAERGNSKRTKRGKTKRIKRGETMLLKWNL